MNGNTWNRFWRRLAAFVFLSTPIRSYGELVLRPATIAERARQSTSAISAGNNNR
jgi:hypothetical protein